MHNAYASVEDPLVVDLPMVLRQTLMRNASIRIQEQQVEIARGALQQSGGAFDPILQVSGDRNLAHSPLSQSSRQTYAQQGYSLQQQTLDTTGYSTVLAKSLRNGMLAQTTLSSTRTTGTTYDLGRQPPTTLGNVNFSLTIPLRKGSGDAAAAGETSSDLLWQASRQDLRHTIAQNVLNAAIAYWNLLSVSRNLEIARESEESASRQLADILKLIEADEIPAAEQNLVRANLADRRVGRIAAEQSLLEARLSLGQTMGLSYAELTRLQVSGDFPMPPTDVPDLSPQRQGLVDLALARRSDLAAAQLRLGANRLLLEASQINLKPRLDLKLGIGYSGLAEDSRSRAYVDAFSNNTTGANAGLTLTYQWAVGNNAAVGSFVQQAGACEQADLARNNLATRIGQNVESTLQGLMHSALQLKAAQEATNIYQLTLENAKVSRRLGSATLLDVLGVEERLRNARLSYVGNRLNYSISLAKLRYETGTLLRHNGDSKDGDGIDLNRIVTMPAATVAAQEESPR